MDWILIDIAVSDKTLLQHPIELSLYQRDATVSRLKIVFPNPGHRLPLCKVSFKSVQLFRREKSQTNNLRIYNI